MYRANQELADRGPDVVDERLRGQHLTTANEHVHLTLVVPAFKPVKTSA